MVVDDSAVIRGLISRWIEAEADMEVAASIRTGLDAVNQIERVDPDVVVLDIEMPDMDGITALPLLLKKKPDLVVIMASTLTRRNAEISFKALALGASDYILKPESTREAGAAEAFKHDLVEKIRHLGARLRRPAAIPSPSLIPAPMARVVLPLTLPKAIRAEQPPLTLRPFSAIAPRASPGAARCVKSSASRSIRAWTGASFSHSWGSLREPCNISSTATPDGRLRTSHAMSG